MGVYTYMEHTLGLVGSPRTVEIRAKIENNEQLDVGELNHLIDCTARWDTLRERTLRDSYKVNEEFSDESYELKELLGNIITELQNVYYMNVDESRKYRIDFTLSSLVSNDIFVHELENEVKERLTIVRNMQKNFDYNKDDLEIIGTFKSKRFKRLSLSFTAKDNQIELTNKIKQLIKKSLEEENTTLQNNLKKFN